MKYELRPGRSGSNC